MYRTPQPATILLYVDDVHTSQETYLWASTACYGDDFTLSYVDDFHTSQGTQASTVRYGRALLFYDLTYKQKQNKLRGP
jgi:hypothetical protein